MIFTRHIHICPLDPVNPAPRGGLAGSKSEGLDPDLTNRKGANPVDPVDRDPDPTNRTCPNYYILLLFKKVYSRKY